MITSKKIYKKRVYSLLEQKVLFLHFYDKFFVMVLFHVAIENVPHIHAGYVCEAFLCITMVTIVFFVEFILDKKNILL